MRYLYYKLLKYNKKRKICDTFDQSLKYTMFYGLTWNIMDI